MAVSFVTERAEDADTSNTTAYTVGSAFTPGANSLLILFTTSTDSAATYDISSVTGGGLTWNLIAEADRDNGTTFVHYAAYYALVGGSPASTTVVVTHDESVTGNISWIGEFSGHNTTTPIKAGQITSGEIASGTETPQMSLPSAPDADSLVLYMNTVIRNPAAWDASGDGWTEHCDTGQATPANGLFVASKANDQDISVTGTNGSSGGIMFEIDAASGATLNRTVDAAATAGTAVLRVREAIRAVAASAVSGTVVARLLERVRAVAASAVSATAVARVLTAIRAVAASAVGAAEVIAEIVAAAVEIAVDATAAAVATVQRRAEMLRQVASSATTLTAVNRLKELNRLVGASAVTATVVATRRTLNRLVAAAGVTGASVSYLRTLVRSVAASAVSGVETLVTLTTARLQDLPRIRKMMRRNR